MKPSLFFAFVFMSCGQSPLAEESSPNWLVRVDGSCAAAHPIDATGMAQGGTRPVGDRAAYDTPIFVSEPSVRVRANAMWSSDQRNVIGTLAGPIALMGEGPLKDADVSAGIGYAVAVEDSQGERCRGYISATVASDDRSAP